MSKHWSEIQTLTPASGLSSLIPNRPTDSWCKRCCCLFASCPAPLFIRTCRCKNDTQPCVVILSVFDDNNDGDNDSDYDAVYSTLKRVQAIISRKSAEGFADDERSRLSQTLTKLVETCSSPRVMRLWSENPRVCAVHFFVALTSGTHTRAIFQVNLC